MDAGSDLSERAAWVARVLGLTIPAPGHAPAFPSALGPPPGDAPHGDRPRPGVVAYRKMLLRWRQAQATLATTMQELGANVLARAEVQRDSRFAAVEKAVRELPRLIPRFGNALEDLLDAGLNATAPVEQARLSAEGVKAVDDYLGELARAPQLQALEQFSAKYLHIQVKLAAELSEALLELKHQLAA